MKKAKIILASLAILAVLGGAFAFKTSRFDPAKQLYILQNGNQWTSTTVGGIVYSTTIPNCTLTNIFVGGLAAPVNTSTSTSAATVQTLFTSAGHSPVLSTYHYCTATFVRTTLAD